MRAPSLPILVLALLVLAPAAASQAPGTTQNERPLSILEYHPYPDPPRGNEGGDPFGVPAPGTDADWMAQYYDAYWFPTTRFDGVLESNYAADGSISGMREFHERYQEHVETRLQEDAPLVAVVNGTLGEDEARVDVRFTPKTDLASNRLVLRTVVFEDDIEYLGDNGVAVHRFVVRHILPEEIAQNPAGGERLTYNHTFTLDPSWNRDRLGVVAFVQNEDETSSAWASKEVLQSATYLFDQDGATVQGTKSVLLEMYTATWCPSCVYGDGAVDLLAEEYGAPSSLRDANAWAYLRTPDLLKVGVGGLAGLAVALVAVPRLRGRGGGDA